jgi:hypothetical protein
LSAPRHPLTGPRQRRASERERRHVAAGGPWRPVQWQAEVGRGEVRLFWRAGDLLLDDNLSPMAAGGVTSVGRRGSCARPEGAAWSGTISGPSRGAPRCAEVRRLFSGGLIQAPGARRSAGPAVRRGARPPAGRGPAADPVLPPARGRKDRKDRADPDRGANPGGQHRLGRPRAASARPPEQDQDSGENACDAERPARGARRSGRAAAELTEAPCRRPARSQPDRTGLCIVRGMPTHLHLSTLGG